MSTSAPDRETQELAADSARQTRAAIPEPSIAGSGSSRTYGSRAGSILGLPAEPSNQPLILGEPVHTGETGIRALSNYGKDVDQKSGRGGTIALLVVIVLAAGAVASYLYVPSVNARVKAFMARMRGTDTQAARFAAMKPVAIIMPSYRPEVNKNMVTARGAVDNISDAPLENLSIEVSLQRGDEGQAEVRTVPVMPNPLPPGQRGAFEFEYDGKRGSGFAGYKITKLFSNGTEVKFRTPGQQ